MKEDEKDGLCEVNEMNGGCGPASCGDCAVCMPCRLESSRGKGDKEERVEFPATPATPAAPAMPAIFDLGMINPRFDAAAVEEGVSRGNVPWAEERGEGSEVNGVVG